MGIEKLAHWALGASLIGGVGALVTFGLIRPLYFDSVLRSTYTQLSYKYADTNKDNFISGVEVDAFEAEVLKDKKVIGHYDQMPIYVETGKEVSDKQMLEWLREYDELHSTEWDSLNTIADSLSTSTTDSLSN